MPAPTYVQHKAFSSTGTAAVVTLDAAPGEGNVQIAYAARREGVGAVFTLDGAGWELIRRTSCSPGDNWPAALYYRVVPAAASATINCTGASDLIVAEFADAGDVDAEAYSGATSGSAVVSITPTEGPDRLVVVGVSIRSDTGATLTPTAGLTALEGGVFSGLGPYSTLGYRVIADAAGAYSVGFTGSAAERAVIAASLLPAAAPGGTGFVGEPGGGCW